MLENTVIIGVGRVAVMLYLKLNLKSKNFSLIRIRKMSKSIQVFVSG